MMNPRTRESFKSFGSLVDPEKAEELKRTKTDIENNMTKILNLIKKEGQSKKDRNPKHSREETELVGLIEDLYNQYQSLYALYDRLRLTGEFGKLVSRRRNRRASLSSSDSDSEYFSSEEVDGNNQRSEKEHHYLSDTTKQKPDIGNNTEELEALMEIRREEMSQYLIQIEKLKENLAEMSSAEHIMLEEKESFLARIKELELELETRNDEKNELEDKLRDRNYENKQLEDENKVLHDRNHGPKGAMTRRGDDISAFLREPENDKNGASMQIMALKAEVNVLRLELDTLHEQKNKLAQQNERGMKEHAESLAKMENLNLKLSSQIADQAATIERISVEHKQAKILSNKFKLNRQSTERKMEELAQEFRKKIEDNIRLLHQRIHIAEQLNNENKNSCKMTKQRYEQENQMLREKVASYEEELRMLKVSGTPSLVGAQNGLLDLEALHGLDFTAEKVEEHKEYVMSHVSKMMSEVRFMKDWIKQRNDQMEKLKDNVNGLNDLLNSKEEQEFLLREKVWELEAKVSKEGGEKLNLTKVVSQLEKKVGKLENNLKEKDEDLVSLGEKKREAIRQLCLVVDFHRDRCNYIKDFVTKMRRIK